MDRLMIAFDEDLGVTAKDLVAAWQTDEEASAFGEAAVEQPGGTVFIPGLVELVVIPLVVNLASSVLYDLLTRLFRRARPAVEAQAEPVLELLESTTAAGDRVVVLRLRDGGR